MIYTLGIFHSVSEWMGMTHPGDLIDADVVLEIRGEVSVAPSTLIMLDDNQRDGAQHIGAQGKVEKHVNSGPDGFRGVGS